MAATVMRFEFTDGSTEDVKITIKAQIEAERVYQDRVASLEGMSYAAWVRLGRPAKKFDDWLETVEDFDVLDTEGNEVDPSQPGASAAS